MSESRRIRSFRCADTLWRALEDEADERGITIDALITEALWSYLRAAPDFASEATQSARLEALMLAAARDAHRRSDHLPSGVGLGPSPAAPSADDAATVAWPASDDARGVGPMVQPRLRPNPDIHALNPSSGPARRSRMEEGEQTLDNLELRFDDEGRLLDPQTGEQIRTEPDPTTDDSKPDIAVLDRPNIALLFSGNRYHVTGDRFLIGRASTGTDLQIRDANVSRKHAAVIFHDGGWFIHDLQSTNGVEFRGRRIHTRRIEHNDRYSICDYELTFELED